MGFLEDMLTFERSLIEGQRIEVQRRRRTFSEWWHNQQIGAPEYRLHYTKAGLPLVLPHSNPEQVYLSPDSQEEPVWTSGGETPLLMGFQLRSIRTNRSSAVVLQCSITGLREIHRGELKESATIDIDYGLDRNGNLKTLDIVYDTGVTTYAHFCITRGKINTFAIPFVRDDSTSEMRPVAGLKLDDTLLGLVSLLKLDNTYEENKRALASLVTLDYFS